MATSRGDLRLLEGAVTVALAVAALWTLLAIPGPFNLFGHPGRVIARHDEWVRVILGERCDLSPSAGTTDGNVGFSGVCEAQLESGGPLDWTAPLHQPGFALARIGTGLLAVVVLFLLRRIVRTVRARDPFITANAGRLRLMGLLVMGVGMGLQFVRFAAEANVLDRVDRLAPGLVWRHDLDLSYWPIAAGVLLLGVAEVFRQGAQLRADVEGLV